MGRPESKIPGDGPVADLARFLRTLRQQAGQTLRPMADRTTYSVSTLSRAANGLHVPSNDVLNEYVRLCDGGRRDQAEAHRLWVQARLHKARPRRPQPRTCTPVTAVTSPADLIAAMHDVRLDAGGPSLRDLEGRAGKLRLVLPRSTVSDALRGASRLPSWRLLEAYVRACGVPENELWLWRTAWQRASGRVDAGDLDMLGDLADFVNGSAHQPHRQPPGSAARPARASVGAEPSLLIRPLPPEIARRLPSVRIPAPRAADTRALPDERTAATPPPAPPPG
ncbi:helix-turn-helix domain-containing protein (plasmid) [Streptomycetaceae bacterium NBC_01309]